MFGCNYKSHQPGRAIRYNLAYCNDKRYASFHNLLHTGDLYSEQFCYHEIPEKLDPFDVETFAASPMEFFVVCTELRTGDPVYHKCRTGGAEDLKWMQASASMPLAARTVKIGQHRLLDGGIADSIPVRFFESIGYRRNVIVLTQPKDYEKKKNKLLPAIRARYARYPAFVAGGGRPGTSGTMRRSPTSRCWRRPARPTSSGRPSLWRSAQWSATPASCSGSTTPAARWRKSTWTSWNASSPAPKRKCKQCGVLRTRKKPVALVRVTGFFAGFSAVCRSVCPAA